MNPSMQSPQNAVPNGGQATPKYPFYVSKKNGSIHLPQQNAPGYEDKESEIFAGALTLAEARLLSARALGRDLTPGEAVDALISAPAVVAQDDAAQSAIPPPPPFGLLNSELGA